MVPEEYKKKSSSVESLEEYFRYVIKNFRAGNGARIVGMQLMLRYSDRVSNSHYCPRNGHSNWSGKNSEHPTSYPGYVGRIWIRYSSGAFPCPLGLCMIHTGTGGFGGYGGPWDKVIVKSFQVHGHQHRTKNNVHVYSYDVRVFVDDFPKIKNKIEASRLKCQLSDKEFFDSVDFEWYDEEYQKLDKEFLGSGVE